MAASERRPVGGPGWAYYLLTALALSVGWGIRGNFGHEYGAMIPGALSAMAVVLLSGRDDWHRRVAYFALFGALGWSFGGSISYMQVVAYTHSGHSPSVLYGFACLFVIGFLWAALGGAGVAFPAFVDRDRLTEMFAPMTAVFVAWWLQGRLPFPGVEALRKYDTDWLAAALAIVAVLVLAAARRRLDRSSILILHMAVGWWAGLAILVLGLGLRMTPPRGDNWSGVLGMSAGLFVYLVCSGLKPVARAMLVTGFVGGVGFASASMLKLVEVTSGLDTNWHSVLEQTTGLFNGLALALAMAGPVRHAACLTEEPRAGRGTEVYAVGFVLLVITYLNFRKNAATWVGAGAMPGRIAGVSASAWFDLAYALVAVAVLLTLVRHLVRPLPLLALSCLGRGQWLFLTFLAWVVVGNFERVVVKFTPERLVTEGVIHLNAAACALLVVLAPGPSRTGPIDPQPAAGTGLGRLALTGLLVATITVAFDWAVVRMTHGDTFAGHARFRVRFGPGAAAREGPH